VVTRPLVDPGEQITFGVEGAPPPAADPATAPAPAAAIPPTTGPTSVLVVGGPSTIDQKKSLMEGFAEDVLRHFT